ncbi:hypothetical protein F5Y05DRAFT_271820 [Hypoxylon sp. FL0543]|nr:hypothetical protein F5Y05DRAFT_271820 [Hypoxylon sp. FL0543]
MIQHLFGLTAANAIRAATGEDVELFAQDPSHSRTTKELLEKAGFSIVGDYGAGGLSKIDDNSLVFACCPAFPIRQLVADLARPAIIIGNEYDHRHSGKLSYPFAFDTISPRTVEMFKEYTVHDIEVVDPEERDLGELSDMKMFVRNAVSTDACVSEGDESAEE